MMETELEAVRISLASPEQIRSWSYGEVSLPETINYRTLKPEKSGLFSERIFGPVKDYECSCGKYKKARFKGVICDRCGVEVAPSRVRRERMGHIELAAPVAHVWFAKGTPNYLSLLLNISPKNLERVLYFSQYIVLKVDEEKRRQLIERLRGEISDEQISQIEEVKPLKLLTESRYQELKKFGDFFKAGMGAEAILEILKELDLNALREKLWQEVEQGSGQKRKGAIKRLKVVEAFLRSGNKPEWMILTVLPVLPPELRPMVQLEGGRFATSDLNDLYRRIINRNNRLKKLKERGVPEVILRNEKRMLQEAVNALLDNGRQGEMVVSGNRKLKSLTDILQGKQGRFRHHLLGKRVDYSGRSVIVVGPELKLHQCGLPRKMAFELFKPFVIRRLLEKGYAHSLKTAKRLIEQKLPEVWEILEEVVKERPVLLNRAPTLHRLSIQAFEPVLVDGSAIKLHPLVCAAFNADFDGDQMAVHVPLSQMAIREAREEMLSAQNMLLPSSGEPTVTPTLDIVLGCYYLTTFKSPAKGEKREFLSYEEAYQAYLLDLIELRAPIKVRQDGKWLETSVGRIIFNQLLPPEIGFINEAMDRAALKKLTARLIKTLGNQKAAQVLDRIKQCGFHLATISGITIGMDDLRVPEAKSKLLTAARERLAHVERNYSLGLLTEQERYIQTVQLWSEITKELTEVISSQLDRYGGAYWMAASGAKGNVDQIKQMVGMRGLMSDPSGKIIEFPILSSFIEGLTPFEYFISTHGSRKGLTDTALRTSDSGYLTRRLVDVAQDVLITEEDCSPGYNPPGILITEPEERGVLPPLADRVYGRVAARPIAHPASGEIIVEVNELITKEKAEKIAEAGVKEAYIRSPLSCRTKWGICRRCYGLDLGRQRLVDIGTAVGIIAAQSIGEPGTQLTLRTFHTGGIVALDITTGLPRVEELFEARIPKGEAIISEMDGTAYIEDTPQGKRVRIERREVYTEEYLIPSDFEVLVEAGTTVKVGQELAKPVLPSLTAQPIRARNQGLVLLEDKRLVISYEEEEVKVYYPTSRILVKDGEPVRAGQRISEGNINPHEILRILGREAVQRYLIDEIQKVYCSQGVVINDKHIEVIVRRMLSKVIVENPGDSPFLPGDLVDRFVFEEVNKKVLAEGGNAATAQPVLLGITRVSLNTDSWLSAASFQETSRVLAKAAIQGKTDYLKGLKENVIIGKLIPSQAIKEPALKEPLFKPKMLEEWEDETGVDGAPGLPPM